MHLARRRSSAPFAGLLALLPTLAAAANFNIPDGDTAALVQAITTADNNGEADTITLAAGSTYSITTPTDGNQALPSINTEMTIVGNGATIERAAAAVDNMRILRLAYSANLTLQDVTIRGGRIAGLGVAGAGILVSSGQLTIERSTITDNLGSDGCNGGGLYVASGPVIVRDSTISANQATRGGGAEVFGPGNLTLERTAVIDNVALPADTVAAIGGGISLRNFGSLTLTDVTLTGNSAQGFSTLDGFGGGIGSEESSAVIKRTTIANNTVSVSGSGNALGGGIYAFGNGPSFTIANSTITGNVVSTTGGALEGGGIYLKGDNAVWTLNNVTIAGNSTSQMNLLPLLPAPAVVAASRGGGIFLGNTGSVSTNSFTLSNTIVGDNTAIAGPECFTDAGKAILSTGYNLVAATTDCTFTSTTGDLTGQGPLLGALTDNGGVTQTMALQNGSPAVNAGSPAAVGDPGACEEIDQRCYGRPAGNRCDIGAFEKDAVNACAPSTTTTTSAPTTTTSPGSCGVPAPTFASIECRLDLLIANITNGADLGKFKKGLLAAATAARARTTSAEDLVGRGKSKPAKKKLKQAGRKVLALVHRLRSLGARKNLPAETRDPLVAQGTPIQADLKTLSNSL